MKIYDIADNYRRAIDAMAESDLPPADWADTLEAIEGEAQEKLLAIAAYAKEMESEADAIDDAAEKMKRRSATARKRAASLKQYAMGSLIRSGMSKMKCPWLSVSVANNGAAPLVIDDESAIPDQFKPLVRVLDKAALRAAIEAGLPVEGAHIGERGQHLRVA